MLLAQTAEARCPPLASTGWEPSSVCNGRCDLGDCLPHLWKWWHHTCPEASGSSRKACTAGSQHRAHPHAGSHGSCASVGLALPSLCLVTPHSPALGRGEGLWERGPQHRVSSAWSPQLGAWSWEQGVTRHFHMTWVGRAHRAGISCRDGGHRCPPCPHAGMGTPNPGPNSFRNSWVGLIPDVLEGSHEEVQLGHKGGQSWEGGGLSDSKELSVHCHSPGPPEAEPGEGQLGGDPLPQDCL